MKRLSRPVIMLVLVGLATLGAFAIREAPAQAPRPYEGTTIRTVVNAEYVKYSISLVEKDIYDKLGIRSRTAVAVLAALDRADQATSAIEGVESDSGS